MLEWDKITEDEILKANIEKYNNDDIVNFYTDFEEPRYSYYEYEVIFQAALNALRSVLGRRVKAVDMCGGAGKAAFALKQCDPSCHVTLVDVSPKMLELARSRARKQAITGINIVNDDALSFLQQEGSYDLIVFSSAVHHFKDPVQLLCAAAEKLSDAGIIITIADPTTLIQSRRFKFFNFLLTNRDAKKKILGQAVKSRLSADAGLVDGDIAEYQALKGIDDKQLVIRLADRGLKTLLHLRYPAGEPFMLRIMPLLGLSWAFSLILCRSGHEYNKQIALSMRKHIKDKLPYRPTFL